MYHFHRWLPEFALRHFNKLAEAFPADFERRYDWGAFQDGPALTEADLDSIYAEVIAKIPAGATKVLEIGCGGGQFAAALRAANPGIGYRGIDIVPANIVSAEALLPAEDFQVGNASEYLNGATMDWDFVVSIGCLFHTTDRRSNNHLFDYLDAKSPKGFVILATPTIATATFLASKMPDAVANSTNVAASYHEGARDFLLDGLLNGVLHPFYIQRDSTSATAPATLFPRECIIERDKFNEVLAQHETRKAKRDGNAVPANVTGITRSGGLVVSASESVVVQAEWVDMIKTKQKPPARVIES